MRRPDPGLVEAFGHLLSLRHVGRDEAATWEVLRAELDHFGYSVPAVRRLQEAAAELRRQKRPVVGVSGWGVFWARTVDEMDEAIGERRRRALSSLAELSVLKRIKAEMLGQSALGLGEGDAT